MKKRVIEDKTLKEVGSHLMQAACLTDQEIDEIISTPSFFDSIESGIEREKMRREMVKASGGRLIFSNPMLQKTALAFGVLLLLSIAFLGLVFSGKNSSPETLPIENTVSQVKEQSPLPFELAPPSKTFDKKIKREKTIQKISLKTGKSKQIVGELGRKKSLQSPAIKDQGEFYPLTFAAELNNIDDDRHIVKAKLSSKELNKLGFYLPLQNQDEVFKTELIVSSDGMPLAVRFLKSF